MTTQSPEVGLWWSELLEGRWSVLGQFDVEGRRYYVCAENDLSARRARGLGQRERRLLDLVASSRSCKAAGHDLGVSRSALSALLKGMLAKLGLRSRSELGLLLRAVGGDAQNVPATPPAIGAIQGAALMARKAVRGRLPRALSGDTSHRMAAVAIPTPPTTKAVVETSAVVPAPA